MDNKNFGETGVNLRTMINRLMSNQNLMKLLYYTDLNPLSHEDIDKEVIVNEILNKQLVYIPLIESNEYAKSYIAILIDSGNKNMGNSSFINVDITVSVLTPISQWMIKDNNLRPFAIMGEIQKSLDEKTVDGFGKIISRGFKLVEVTDEVTIYQLLFTNIEYD